MASIIEKVWRKIAGLPPAPEPMPSLPPAPTLTPDQQAKETYWTFERHNNIVIVVVRNARGALVAIKKMTAEGASRTAAQLWNIANFDAPGDGGPFAMPKPPAPKPGPTEVHTNDPDAVAESIFGAPLKFPSPKSKPDTKATSKLPCLTVLGPAFTVESWPTGKIRELINRPVRFAWVNESGKLREDMGRIIEVMPYGRRRMLTIETDVGHVMIFRNLEDVELFGRKKHAIA